MTQQIINIGSAPNDGTGDQLRTSFDKCNLNFTEIYQGLVESLPLGNAIEYRFNNNIAEPPSLAEIRVNAAPQAGSTKLWASHTASSGINIKQFLSAATAGSRFILQDKNDNTNYLKLNVTGSPVDKTSYWEFPIAVTASGGNLPSASILVSVTAASGSSGFPEAPTDGIVYGRRGSDATWQPSPVGATGPQGPAGATGAQGPKGDPQTPSDANPLIDGTATPGASALYSRGDHVHPTDTSRAALTQVVRYDAAQTLTAAQKAQARANIDVLKRNYIINGAMMISQENGATAGAGAAGVGYYPVDAFCVLWAGTTGAYLTNQLTGAPITPAGSPNRLYVTVNTADTSVGTSDLVQIFQNIEGFRIADLKFGSASAKQFTLQFGVNAPAGTYCVTFINAASNRSYVAEYVIAAGEAGTDVVKTITVQGDTSGTWAKDNTTGLGIHWCLMAGTTFQQAASSWGTGNVVGSPNQFNFMGAVNNQFQLFDVGLYEGTTAPPFQVPDYASELQLCLRYWEKLASQNLNASANQGGVAIGATFRLTRKRAAPSTSGANQTFINCTGFSVDTVTPDSIRMYASSSAVGAVFFQTDVIANARL